MSQQQFDFFPSRTVDKIEKTDSEALGAQYCGVTVAVAALRGCNEQVTDMSRYDINTKGYNTGRKKHWEYIFLPVHWATSSPTIMGRHRPRSLPNDDPVGRIWELLDVLWLPARSCSSTSWSQWAAAHYGIEDGIGTIQNGGCDTTKTLSLWSHFAINVLSTAMLSASNYCMQCLSAPTRQDIDRAHAQHIWLDIGVRSVRNLLHISRTKTLLWILLALSSIPLHLFYNSAIFSTLSAREYDILTISPNLAVGKFFNATAVPRDALNPRPYDHSYSDEWAFPPYPRSRLIEYGLSLMRDFNNTSVWQRMDNRDCIQKYGRQFISTRSDFLAVSHALNDSFSIKFIDTAYPKTDNGGGPSYNWMCDLYPDAQHGRINEQCRLDLLLPKATKWAIRSNRLNEPSYGMAWQPDLVDYCLSRQVKEECRLQFSLALLIVVIMSNFVKAACMIVIVYRHDDTPLITLGDAIASFLDDPDSTTQGNCVAPGDSFKQCKWTQHRRWTRQPRPWATKKAYWFSSSSWKRWISYNTL
ncbi:MAG: hypothetical protein Q9176_003920 [Flavoplaca citrina]